MLLMCRYFYIILLGTTINTYIVCAVLTVPNTFKYDAVQDSRMNVVTKPRGFLVGQRSKQGLGFHNLFCTENEEEEIYMKCVHVLSQKH